MLILLLLPLLYYALDLAPFSTLTPIPVPVPVSAPAPSPTLPSDPAPSPILVLVPLHIPVPVLAPDGVLPVALVAIAVNIARRIGPNIGTPQA